MRNVTIIDFFGHIPSELNEILRDFDSEPRKVGRHNMVIYGISRTTTVAVWLANPRGDIRVNITTRAT
jgi:hypothetical protein